MFKSRYFRSSMLAAVALALTSAAYASDTTIQIGASTSGAQNSAADYKTTVTAATAGKTVHEIAVFDHIFTSNLNAGNSNYAFKSITNFGVTAAQAGAWSFDASVDFGKGGALFIDGTAYAFKNSNLYTGGNASQNLAATLNLSAGNHTLALYGLEDCCGGYNSVKYSIGTSAFKSFSKTDGLNVSAVPEPETYAMLLAGLGLMGFVARRKAVTSAA